MNPRALIGLTVIAAVAVLGSRSAATPQGMKGTIVCSQSGLKCRTTVDAHRDAGEHVSGTVRVEYDLQAVGMGKARCEARVEGLETKGGITRLGAVITRSSRPGMLPLGSRLEMRVRDLGGGQLEMLEGQMVELQPIDSPLSPEQAARR